MEKARDRGIFFSHHAYCRYTADMEAEEVEEKQREQETHIEDLTGIRFDGSDEVLSELYDAICELDQQYVDQLRGINDDLETEDPRKRKADWPSERHAQFIKVRCYVCLLRGGGSYEEKGGLAIRQACAFHRGEAPCVSARIARQSYRGLRGVDKLPRTRFRRICTVRSLQRRAQRRGRGHRRAHERRGGKRRAQES